MKKILFILLTLICINCLAQKPVVKQTPADALQTAYKKKSVTQLNSFFENWHSELPCITREELSTLNDTLRAAYSVYNAYYKPIDIKGIGGSEFGNSIYQNVKYLIIQNTLDVEVDDKVYYTEEEQEQYAINAINNSKMVDSIKKEYLERTNGRLPAVTIERFGPSRTSLLNMISKKQKHVIKIKTLNQL